MSTNRSNVIEFDRRRAERQAAKAIERWRNQGFDRLVCYPTGYCAPANSRVLRAELPPGYAMCPLDSEEALASVVASIESGTVYRT